jgi:hypothetical protein
LFFLIFYLFFFCSTLALVKNHTHKWNTFISWFIDWKVIIIIYCCYFLIFFLTHIFITICFYSEIEFIKPSDDVKIQRKTITFTKDLEDHMVFINKMINSRIMDYEDVFFFIIFIFIYSILLAKCYAFVQMIIIVLVWEIFFLL